MDANKRNKLLGIEYKIAPSCETCLHADISSDGWGYCGAHEYQHEKHNEISSLLSVHRLGSCHYHEWNDTKIAELGLHAFHEFLDKPE